MGLQTSLINLFSKNRKSRLSGQARKLASKRRLLMEALEGRRVFAAFTPGNLAIYRVGNGTETLANTGNTVFIDEYTPAGSLVQSIQLPNSGGNSLVANGTSTSEGGLSLSGDGNFLLLAGYGPAAIPAASSLQAATGATVNRVVGRIDGSGTIDTSTRLSDFASGSSPRSAASTDGTDLWVAGGAGGVRYATLGSTTSTQLAATPTNLRHLTIADGQLYVSSQSGSTRLATVGTGIPTTAGQTITNLPGAGISSLTSPYGSFFADLSAGVPGVDTLYVADDGASGLQKFSLVGGSWVSNGIIGVDADDYRGVTGIVSGTTVSLFVTRKGGGTAAGGELVSLVDASGYNGAFAGTPTLLASASAGTSFRGIAKTPGVAASAILSVAAGSASKLEGDGGGLTPFTFTVSRSGLTTGSSSANWAVTGSGASPANAVDFQSGVLPSGTVTFAADELSKTITVQVVADSTFEPDESFTVTLSSPSSGTTISTGTATGLIINDDAAIEYQVAATDLVKLEGTGVGTDFSFTVTRSGDTSGSSTVDYAVTGAVTANDFVPSTALPAGTVTFLAGETSIVVTLTVDGDTAVESDENFTVTLSNPSAGGAVSVPTANGTILNDDASLSIQTAVVRQPEGNAGTTVYQYTIIRTGYLSSAVTATWGVSGGTTAPADGTDFVGGAFPNGSVSFPADGVTTTQIVSVNVQGDTVVELDENFTLTLSNPSFGAIIGTATRGGIIENDEIQPMSAGDVVITGMNTAGNDGFSFVPLIDLLPGTVLKFTDNAWSGSALTTNEGYAVFTVGASGVAKGTEVTIDIPTAATATVAPAAAGSIAVDGGFQLSNGGDNLFVFQGPLSTPAFLFAINFGGAYLTSGGTSTTTTYLPSSLTIGTSAVDSLGIPSAITTAQYNDILISGTKADLRNAVASSANWVVSPLTVQDFTVAASNSTVVGRSIFYRGTSFDDGSPNPVGAIDTSKSALLPGQTTTNANYINYRDGITGIFVDIDGLVSASASDFQFATSNGVNPFVASAVVPTVSVVSLGAGQPSRVRLDFAANSVRNTWFRITVLANANTALAANDVFYFGSAAGDVYAGNIGTPLVVRTNATDTSAVRQNQSPTLGSAAVTNLYDLNKDSRVNSSDTSVTRQNINSSILTFFTAPASLMMASEGLEFSVPPMATGQAVAADASEVEVTEGLADEETADVYMGTAEETVEITAEIDEISPVEDGGFEETSAEDLLAAVDAFFRELAVS
jgi:hypothetical protein